MRLSHFFLAMWASSIGAPAILAGALPIRRIGVRYAVGRQRPRAGNAMKGHLAKTQLRAG
jgi:hypothetical protein